MSLSGDDSVLCRGDTTWNGHTDNNRNDQIVGSESTNSNGEHEPQSTGDGIHLISDSHDDDCERTAGKTDFGALEMLDNDTNGYGEYVPDNDAEMALTGINILLNQGNNDAFNYFSQYKHNSPLMHYGYSFVKFMNASISMDEVKLGEALSALEETQKLCESSSTGFLKTLKSAFRRQPTESVQLSQYEKYQRHIIMADCLLYQASLIISIHQDIPGFIRGGWMLRKSQKHFDKVHRELKLICDNKTELKDPNANMGSYSEMSTSSSNTSLTDPTDPSELTADEAERLLGGASFGYGLLQLCVSMLPPKITRVISFLGFEGDRRQGLVAMEFASYSKDMRGPIAMLGLLWYHTIIRQFFSIEGYQDGVDQASQIIERFDGQYGDSPLFLWFKGRLSLLKCDIEAALGHYRRARDSGQIEVYLLCTYEIGWASLIVMDWKESLQCYTTMKDQPRWATSLYTYLAALSHGALGNLDNAQKLLHEVQNVKCRRGNPNDVFIVRRAARVLTFEALTSTDYIMLILEILCIWNAFITTPQESMREMLQESSKMTNKNLLHIRMLAEGSIYKEMKEFQKARETFDQLITKKPSKKKEELHVTAHAYFELGTMLASDASTVQEGRALLVHLKDKIKDYELENRLHIRLHAALEQIKNNGIFGK